MNKYIYCIPNEQFINIFLFYVYLFIDNSVFKVNFLRKNFYHHLHAFFLPLITLGVEENYRHSDIARNLFRILSIDEAPVAELQLEIVPGSIHLFDGFDDQWRKARVSSSLQTFERKQHNLPLQEKGIHLFFDKLL